MRVVSAEEAVAGIESGQQIYLHCAAATSLKEGAGVVTTRAHVRTVVTEWGVASCSGGACANVPRHSSQSPTRTSAIS